MKRPWWVFGLAALWLELAGCGLGPPDPDATCLDWDCNNEVALSGSLPVDHEVESVRGSSCVAETCEDFVLDLATPPPDGCSWGRKGSVCVEQEHGELEVSAVWSYTNDLEDVPRGIPHRLRLVDGSTGRVLLDETRASNPKVTQEDACHRCWRDQMTF